MTLSRLIRELQDNFKKELVFHLTSNVEVINNGDYYFRFGYELWNKFIDEGYQVLTAYQFMGQNIHTRDNPINTIINTIKEYPFENTMICEFTFGGARFVLSARKGNL